MKKKFTNRKGKTKDREKEVAQPHSNFVTGILSDIGRALEFFKLILPEDIFALIDVKTFKLEPTFYVDRRLKHHQSDLLFSFHRRGSKGRGARQKIYLLFEHKSSYKNGVLDQSLRYQARIYETIKPRGIIIPIIFYHSEGDWRKQQDFQESFDLPNDVQDLLKPLALNFRPLYINAKNIPFAQVDQVWLWGFLTILIRIFSLKGDEKKLRELVRELKGFLLAEIPSEVYEMSLSYLSIAGGYESEMLVTIISEEISEEAGGKAMRTLADERIDWKKEGRKEGLEEGLEKKAIQIARKLSKSGMPLSEIKRITGLSKSRLQKAKVS